MTTGWHVPPPAPPPTCLLCGDQGHDVAMAMARFEDGAYGSLPRCRDAIGCRRRVIEAGGAWELDDGMARR